MKKFVVLLALSCLAFLPVLAQNTVGQMVYFVLGDTTIERSVWDVMEIKFEEDNNPYKPAQKPTAEEAVDLGLSVKWAPYNFGASSGTTRTDSCGVLVGWGDCTVKCLATDGKFYPGVEVPQSIIKKYDVAQLYWGDDWRLPTTKEIAELLDSCEWTWKSDTVPMGYWVKSKKTAGKIFLPVTGYRQGRDTLDKELGYYWSGILSGDNRDAYALKLGDGLCEDSVAKERFLGLAIRPVYGRLGVTLKSSIKGLPSYSLAQVLLELGGDCDYVEEFGVYCATSKDELNINNAHKRNEVPESKSKVFTLKNLTPNTEYYCVAYVKESGKLIEDTLTFTTAVKFPVPTEPVDLGLSVKWAPWNMGAANEKEYGGYYGWGDATGDLTSTSNADYAVGNTSADISGDVKYDIATAQWGEGWRMPTRAEFEELKNLSWAAVTLVAADGTQIFAHELTSRKTGKSIYMPACGYILDGQNTMKVNENAFYWTSDRADETTAYYGRIFNSAYVMVDATGEKKYRMPIRPVYDEPESEPEENAEGKLVGEVDLGLSVLWADRNVGAFENANAYGEYFAYGDLVEKDNFSKENYDWYDATNDVYTWAITDISNTEYDVAKKRWEGLWRMPTHTECQELVNGCNWEWVDSPVAGYKVSNKSDAQKYIFLPAAGYINSTTLSARGTAVSFWTSSAVQKNDTFERDAYRLIAVSGAMSVNSLLKYIGLTVRPVREKPKR